MPGFELFGEKEKKHVQDVLDSGILMRYNFDGARNGHWKAKEFEDKLSALLKVSHTHLCSSGTAALAIALAGCGIGKGDEVIVTPFTFIATIESIINCGAVPVFADIDKTLCLSPESIEEKITTKTKAVLPVHMCGSMAHIDKIKEDLEPLKEIYAPTYFILGNHEYFHGAQQIIEHMKSLGIIVMLNENILIQDKNIS